MDQLFREINGTLPWFGAIFGGTYAALYTRFSSQWSYLAELYNQQTALAITITKSQLNGENYAIWQAAFIEDAVCMHLARKPCFSNAILTMLEDKSIRINVESEAHLGKDRIEKLIEQLKSEVKQELL